MSLALPHERHYTHPTRYPPTRRKSHPNVSLVFRLWLQGTSVTLGWPPCQTSVLAKALLQFNFTTGALFAGRCVAITGQTTCHIWLLQAYNIIIFQVFGENTPASSWPGCVSEISESFTVY